VIDDGVYFDTSKSKGYGKLARLRLGGMMPGARVEANPQKKNPSDFALWKFSPKGSKRDMEWDSPWGTGFPGWHLECSAMSMKYLGKTFDIHCGGIDHIPIHHTNEIAQSEGATGKKFVDYWVHAAHLIVEGRRMAKSLGNFYTLSTIMDKGYDPMSLRFFYLQAHYRRELNFTYEGLDAARNAMESIQEFVRRLNDRVAPKSSARIQTMILHAGVRFVKAMNDDLDTPAALAVLFRFIGEMNRLMDDGQVSRADAKMALKLMLLFDKILGLNLKRSLEKEDLPEHIKELIEEREQARKVGDYGRADAIRRRLRDESGITLEDTPQGVKWKKSQVPTS